MRFYNRAPTLPSPSFVFPSPLSRLSQISKTPFSKRFSCSFRPVKVIARRPQKSANFGKTARLSFRFLPFFMKHYLSIHLEIACLGQTKIFGYIFWLSSVLTKTSQYLPSETVTVQEPSNFLTQKPVFVINLKAGIYGMRGLLNHPTEGAALWIPSSTRSKSLLLLCNSESWAVLSFQTLRAGLFGYNNDDSVISR